MPCSEKLSYGKDAGIGAVVDSPVVRRRILSGNAPYFRIDHLIQALHATTNGMQGLG
jgi:hypothetical protein